MNVSSAMRVLTTIVLGSTCLQASPGTVPVSHVIVGSIRHHVIVTGESLVALGARFGVDADVIATANDLLPGAALVAGQRLTIDDRHVVAGTAGADTLVVNVPQRMLFVHGGGGHFDGFPVAVGEPDWPTPVGAFRVVVKEEHPTWDVPVSIQEEMRRAGQRVITRMAPGPRNPLGDYWIGLSLGSIGLHGTPYPSTIYRFATHGCVRLHPDDIAKVYRRVAVGTTVAVVYQPVLMAATADGLFLEAHRDVYRRVAPGPDDVRRAAAAAGVAAHVDWKAAAAVLRRREGVARAVSLR
jgi:L,D-transpeptidase ErfK/SrfK